MRESIGRAGLVVAFVAFLILPACISKETQARLDQADRDVKAAEAARGTANSELQKIIDQLKNASTEDAARLEAEKAAAAAKLEAAKKAEADAAAKLVAERDAAAKERFKNGVQIAEWAHGGIGSILGMFLPAIAPVLTIVGSVIQSAKEKANA